MKQKVLNKIYIIILFLFALFPLTNVKAAVQEHKTVKLNTFSSARSGTYFMGPGQTYTVTSNWIFHEIRDGSDIYLAYCLNHALDAPTKDGTIYNTVTTVKDNYGNPLTETRRHLLENVLASGYQYTNDVDLFINSATKESKRNAAATQIIIWEIISGGRDNYNYRPNNISNNSYDFISTDSSLLQEYKKILDAAKDLDDDSKPDSFNKEYVMHWSDSQSQYMLSSPVDIGKYSLDTSKTLDTITVEGKTSLLNVYSEKYFTGNKEVPLKLVRGNTTLNGFKWFEFNDDPYSHQNFALGSFGLTKTGKFYVKVEKGKFKLAKYNDDGELVKGAIFKISKCKDAYAIGCDAFKTVDLTNQAYQDIEILKTGYYLFEEIKVPFGYEKVEDFILELKIDDNGIVKTSSNYSHVQINNNNTAEIKVSVINKAKNFKIKKIDASNSTAKEVKGASFKIKNLNGQYMKFNEVNGVYRYSKDGTIDVLKNNNLSTYTVSLLPAGEYILEEIGTPYPYNMSSSQKERETKFKIDNEANLWEYNYSTNSYSRSVDLTIDVKNFKTKVKIVKNGKNGEKLSGVIFELWNSSKTSQIAVKTMANGEYEYNRDSSAQPIQLITNSKGEIVINYLPEGSYFVKEVQTVDGYVIDKDVEWTNFKVEIKRSNATTNLQITINNQKSQFCFYKMDEDGNYLDDGKFKIQIYNEKKSTFEDIPLIFDKNDNQYTIDSTYKSDVYIFSPVSNGQTCFKDVPAKTRYKIVELTPPAGFLLGDKNESEAQILMNENGYAIGAPVIINRKEILGEGAEAQAELIISINTGQDRIHYIIIISILLLCITGLLILKHKINKK